jgi:hypothetical protein
MEGSIPTPEQLRRHQQRLAETIRATARWRRAKAEEHPADRRENVRSALSLRTLANFVAGLEPDDLDLRCMRASRLTEDGQAYRLSVEASARLARFGYVYGTFNTKTGALDEAQLRNVLRRVEGQEAQNRHLMRQRAEAGYGEG